MSVVAVALIGVGGCGGSSTAINPADVGRTSDVDSPDSPDVVEDVGANEPDVQTDATGVGHRPSAIPARNEGTVGAPCNDDRACDPARSGEGFCTNDGNLSFGTIYPTPVCILATCTSDSPSSLARCDGDRGVCVSQGSAVGVCLPRCTFGQEGAQRGCIGNDLCAPSGVTRDDAGAIQGEGSCVGGCRVDSDCTKGDRCQVDQGFCVTRTFERTLAIGEPCYAGANPPEIDCNCRYAPTTMNGYCTALCVTGDPTSSCPDGFACSTGLDGALLDHEPSGLAGNCLKRCESDADCAGLASTCARTPSGKVCLPGG